MMQVAHTPETRFRLCRDQPVGTANRASHLRVCCFAGQLAKSATCKHPQQHQALSLQLRAWSILPITMTAMSQCMPKAFSAQFPFVLIVGGLGSSMHCTLHSFVAKVLRCAFISKSCGTHLQMLRHGFPQHTATLTDHSILKVLVPSQHRTCNQVLQLYTHRVYNSSNCHPALYQQQFTLHSLYSSDCPAYIK